MDKYSLNYLSDTFYSKYNVAEYPEIENKNNRPYIVILIRIEQNTFAIPFRTNVKHSNCYKFRTSTRHTNSVTGLDYTKAVIVNDSTYIGEPAIINNKEYSELDARFHIIEKEFKNYVKSYIRYAKGYKGAYNMQKFKYTTLQYFHKELGIE